MKRLTQIFVAENKDGIACAITVWVVAGLLALASYLGIDRPIDLVATVKFAALASVFVFLGMPLFNRVFRQYR